MKSLLKFGQVLVLGSLLWLATVGCSQIDQVIPPAPDSTSKTLPPIAVEVGEISDSVDLDFSRIIESNEPFSLSFFGFQYGRIVLRAGNKFRYISESKVQWVADSGFYDFCKGINCGNGKGRRGKIKIKNNHRTSNTVFIALPNIGPFYLGYLGSIDPYLIPKGRIGKVKEIKHNFFTASIVVPDSTKVLYFAGSGIQGPFLMGYDDVVYKIKTVGDTIFTGQFSVVLGDTTDAQARSDSFNVVGGEANWTTMDWATNDEPLFAPLENFTIKIQPTNYTGSLKINTNEGVLNDTIINGEQRLIYKRTNPAAGQDVFPYYLLSHSNNRLSRAWIKIKFN